MTTDDDARGTIHEPATIVQPENLSLHETSRIDSFCLINCTGGVTIEERSVIHAGSHVVGRGGLRMGPRSVVTYNCVLVTTYPRPERSMSSVVDKSETDEVSGRIDIGTEAFVGSGSVLMPGIELGPGAVVAAGSYVDEDVPPLTIRYPDGSTSPRPGDWSHLAE